MLHAIHKQEESILEQMLRQIARQAQRSAQPLTLQAGGSVGPVGMDHAQAIMGQAPPVSPGTLQAILQNQWSDQDFLGNGVGAGLDRLPPIEQAPQPASLGVRQAALTGRLPDDASDYLKRLVENAVANSPATGTFMDQNQPHVKPSPRQLSELVKNNPTLGDYLSNTLGIDPRGFGQWAKSPRGQGANGLVRMTPAPRTGRTPTVYERDEYEAGAKTGKQRRAATKQSRVNIRKAKILGRKTGYYGDYQQLLTDKIGTKKTSVLMDKMQGITDLQNDDGLGVAEIDAQVRRQIYGQLPKYPTKSQQAAADRAVDSVRSARIRQYEARQELKRTINLSKTPAGIKRGMATEGWRPDMPRYEEELSRRLSEVNGGGKPDQNNLEEIRNARNQIFESRVDISTPNKLEKHMADLGYVDEYGDYTDDMPEELKEEIEMRGMRTFSPKQRVNKKKKKYNNPNPQERERRRQAEMEMRMWHAPFPGAF